MRVPLITASRLADDVMALLEPSCERIKVAGSIRRERPDIGDIDLVCVPRLHMQTAPSPEDGVVRDLFGDVVGKPSAAPAVVTVSELDTCCAALLDSGMFQYRLNVKGQKSWGHDLKKGTYRGLNIDICSATDDTWAYWMAIRTGPAEFSKRMVTDRRHGGFCPHYLHFKGARLRRVDNEEPIDTPDEETLFRELGLAWLPPIVRTDTCEPRRLAGSRS